MYTLRVIYKPYIIFEFTILITQISIQSYTWPNFQFIVLLNLMFTI